MQKKNIKKNNNSIASPEVIKEIQSIIQEFMEKMGFKVKTVPRLALEAEEEILVFNLIITNEQDCALLIGRFGANLRTLHNFLRLFTVLKMNERLEERPRFVLDINDYFEHHKDYLRKIALQAGRQAIKNREAVELEPMNAFERRFIHLIFAKSKKVTTESTGEGSERRVLIKPL